MCAAWATRALLRPFEPKLAAQKGATENTTFKLVDSYYYVTVRTSLEVILAISFI